MHLETTSIPAPKDASDFQKLYEAQERGRAAAAKAKLVMIANEPDEKEDPLADDCRAAFGFFHPDLKFTKTKKGIELKPHSHNLSVILKHHPAFKIDLHFSEFFNKEMLGSEEVSDVHVTDLKKQLEELLDREIKKENLRDAMSHLAHANTRNELREWFLNLPATSTTLLDTWLTRYLGVEDTPLTRAMGRKWLVSGVARALEPGCYYEGMLIIQGDGGIGKSSALKALCPDVSWFCDNSVDLANEQKCIETYAGTFIIELAELEGLRKSNINATKEFLTRTTDRARLAYGYHRVVLKRTSIYAGTTNESVFLTDTSGSSRRFWCVTATTIDVESLKRDMQALWREALDAYRAGEPWHLSPEELAALNEANELREVGSQLQSTLEDYLSKTSEEVIPVSRLDTEVLERLKYSRQELANVMRRFGWSKKKKRFGNHANPVWCFVKEGGEA